MAHTLMSANALGCLRQDIGFGGIASELGSDDNVINKYFDVFFPRAVRSSAILQSAEPAMTIFTVVLIIAVAVIAVAVFKPVFARQCVQNAFGKTWCPAAKLVEMCIARRQSILGV